MEIIPAIDLIDGKCVRLQEGNFATKQVYHDDPVTVARTFEEAGLRRLHVVDLDGARAGKMVNQAILGEIAAATQLRIDYSGGIRSDEDIALAFDLGAQLVCCGSIAIESERLFLSWLTRYGSDRIILAADVVDNKVSIHAWQKKSDVEIMDFISYFVDQGIRNLMCTDISKDGLLQGTSLELYRRILNQFPEINLIASGGVTRIDEIAQLHELGCSGAIIGRALYEGQIELRQLADWHAD